MACGDATETNRRERSPVASSPDRKSVPPRRSSTRCPVGGSAASARSNSVHSGPGRRWWFWAKTPLTKNIGVASGPASSHEPRVPERPLPSAPSASAIRSRAGSPGSGTIQVGSRSICGTRWAARRASCWSRRAMTCSGPPPRWTTPSAAPVGASPTETTAARRKPSTSMGESRPSRPSSDPKALPTISVNPPVIPRSASQAATHRRASTSPAPGCAATGGTPVCRATRSSAPSSSGSAVRPDTGPVPLPVTATSSLPRLPHRYSVPGPRGLACSWLWLCSTATSLTTNTCTPAALSASRRPRSPDVSARRSGTAAPSQPNTIASKVVLIALVVRCSPSVDQPTGPVTLTGSFGR